MSVLGGSTVANLVTVRRDTQQLRLTYIKDFNTLPYTNTADALYNETPI